MRKLVTIAVVAGAIVGRPALAVDEKFDATVYEPPREAPREDAVAQAEARAATQIYTGAGTYTFPFRVPPGRLGMTPDLALTYNSQGRADGALSGLGSDLDLGFPFIERRLGTADAFFYRKGFARAPLISCANGTCPGVSEPGEYRVRLDGAQHLRFFFENGYWVTYDKRGHKRVYGKGVRAYNVSVGTPPEGAEPFRWPLEREEDGDRNAIVYSYSCTRCCATCARPSKIEYSTVVDASGMIIEPGAYTVALDWRGSRALVAVFRTGAQSALYSYDVTPNSVNRLVDGTPKRVLGITRSTATRRSQRWPVGGTVNLGTHAYRGGGNGEQAFAADFDGDGRTDVARTQEGWDYWDVSISTGSGFVTVKWETPASHTSTATQVLVADFDGDGLTDILRGIPGGTFELLRSTGSGFAPTQITSNIFSSSTTEYGGIVKQRTVVAGDFNGDGLADLASPTWWITTSVVDGTATATTHRGWSMALGRSGGAFQDIQKWELPEGEVAFEDLEDGLEALLVADFTGDGKTDIARVRGTGLWKIAVANASGNGFDFQMWTGGPKIPQAYSMNMFAIDADGDGLAGVTTAACGTVIEDCPAYMEEETPPDGPYATTGWGRWVRNPACSASCVSATCTAYTTHSNSCSYWKAGVPWYCSISDGPPFFVDWNAFVPGYNVVPTCRVTNYAPSPLHGAFSPNGTYGVARGFTGIKVLAPVGRSIAAEAMSATGNGLWLPANLETPMCTPKDIVLGDFNGSGTIDIACAPRNSDAWYLIIDDDVTTTTFVDEMGATTRMTFAPASQLRDRNEAPIRHVLRSPVRVVIEVAVDDGTGASLVTSYSYQGGFTTSNGEFRGFRVVEESLPSGHVRNTWFHQETDRGDPDEESDFAGLPQRTETRLSSGELLTATSYTYTRGAGAAGTYPAYALLQREEVESRGGWNDPTTWVAMSRVIAYDEYGNVTDVTSSGTDAASFTLSYGPFQRLAGLRGDARRTVHLPAGSKLLDSGGNVVRKTVLTPYPADAAGGSQAKPSKMTQTYCELLPANDPKRAGCTDPAVSFEYNSMGLQTKVTDPKGVATKIEYETVANSYPKALTRTGGATSRVTAEITYDYRFGTPECVKDERGVSTCLRRFADGRPTEPVNVNETTRC